MQRVIVDNIVWIAQAHADLHPGVLEARTEEEWQLEGEIDGDRWVEVEVDGDKEDAEYLVDRPEELVGAAAIFDEVNLHAYRLAIVIELA